MVNLQLPFTKRLVERNTSRFIVTPGHLFTKLLYSIPSTEGYSTEKKKGYKRNFHKADLSLQNMKFFANRKIIRALGYYS